MQRSQPFARAIAVATAISAAMALPVSLSKAAMAEIGPYQSQGKGGKRNQRSVGTKAHQRAAAKSRNVRRSRGK